MQRRPPELIGRVHVTARLVKRPQAARRAGTSGVEGGGRADVVSDVGGGTRSEEEAQRLRTPSGGRRLQCGHPRGVASGDVRTRLEQGAEGLAGAGMRGEHERRARALSVVSVGRHAGV